MELVTGRKGEAHITSQHDRQQNQGVWGTGAYILNTGNNLEASAQSSNIIQIKDGALMSQGALFSVPVGTVDEVTIENGTQGMQRKDVIVARYTYDQIANTETGEWVVIQGEAVEANPSIPSITSGDIQNGDTTVDTAVFIVTLDGINITDVETVPEVIENIADMKETIDELSKEHVEYTTTVSTTLGTTIRYRRRGAHVMATHVGVIAVGTANTEYTIASIPAGYRPVAQFFQAVALVTSATISGTARWLFEGSNVRMICSNNASREHCVTVCYFTDDDFPDE